MKEHKHEEEPKVNKKDKHAHHDHKIEDKKDEHNHDGFDPHVWLDPILVKIQSKKNIYEAVVKVDEANSDFYKVNYEAFIKELDELDSKIATIFSTS